MQTDARQLLMLTSLMAIFRMLALSFPSTHVLQSWWLEGKT